ncbi:hypothetical protein I317_00584 [Kwoniella heveanensis CBS 569]|nr:hypothetical protein I317_00584 [Kwoniella heveanensis CBS 569]
MPFLRSSTRPTAVQCFFCLSPSLLPPHPSANADGYSYGRSQRPGDRKDKAIIAEVGTKWNWQCERCGCWNIRDSRGEMISDLPAMHDTAHNERSFSLRATPSSSHLPSSSNSSSTFCHSCLANQTLIMNMLANYLPDDDDPSFPQLYAELPSYLAKLHSRYPPVCQNCQPAVDEALRKSDHKAQVEAWGSALKRGARSGISSSWSGTSDTRAGSDFKGARSCLWYLPVETATTHPSLLAEVLYGGRLGRYISPSSLVLFHMVSITWIAWDPYWLRRVRSRDQAKVQGRDVWVRNMLIILVLRVITSIAAWFMVNQETQAMSNVLQLGYQIEFGLEIALLIHATMNIRISQPVAIQLVRPVSLRSSPAHPTTSLSTPPHPASPGHLSTLSIGQSASASSLKPERANPIFGQMSLSQQYGAGTAEPQLPSEEPMDWEPSPSPASYQAYGNSYNHMNRPPGLFTPEDEDDMNFHHASMYPRTAKHDWDGFATNRQRMFPQRAEETGLESLLAGWGIGGGGAGTGTASEGNSVAPTHTGKYGMVRAPKPSLRRFDINRIIGFALVAVRVLGASVATSTHDGMSKVNYLESANQMVQLVELTTTCVRLSILLRPSTQRTPGTKAGLGIVIATLEIVLRGMALSTFDSLWTSFGITDNAAMVKSVEWAVWGTIDLVDVLMLP